jgi:hypothetical protein
LPPGVAEAVLAKVKVSAGLAVLSAGAASTATSSASGPAVTAAKGGALGLLRVLPVVTLAAGIGLGIAADRLVLRPQSVSERVVIERVEVPVAPTPEKPAEKPAPPRGPSKKPALVADTLGRERILLDLARSALAAKDVNQALAAVQSHESQFPSGQLVEEREALTVQVLWAAGRRVDATRRLHAFGQQFPDSPLRPALDAMMR